MSGKENVLRSYPQRMPNIVKPLSPFTDGNNCRNVRITAIIVSCIIIMIITSSGTKYFNLNKLVINFEGVEYRCVRVGYVTYDLHTLNVDSNKVGKLKVDGLKKFTIDVGNGAIKCQRHTVSNFYAI